MVVALDGWRQRATEVYEAALAPDGWRHGDALPAADSWKPLTREKASTVLASRQDGKVHFNHGAEHHLAARAYRNGGEQDGVWLFIAQVARNGNILVRAARGIVLTLTVTGRTIKATSIAGNTEWQYTVPLNEHVRVLEARQMITEHMHAQGRITLSIPVECMKPESLQPMRGNQVLVHRMIPIPRAKPRRRSRSREPGQQTLMGYSQSASMGLHVL